MPPWRRRFRVPGGLPRGGLPSGREPAAVLAAPAVIATARLDHGLPPPVGDLSDGGHQVLFASTCRAPSSSTHHAGISHRDPILTAGISPAWHWRHSVVVDTHPPRASAASLILSNFAILNHNPIHIHVLQLLEKDRGYLILVFMSYSL